MFFTRLKQVIKTYNLLILYNLTCERQDLDLCKNGPKLGPSRAHADWAVGPNLGPMMGFADA
jgi:hypothetical protein